MFYTYVLSSIFRNYIYVGLTDNVERRFSEHQSGKNATTKAYKPFKIILIEAYPSRFEARIREKYLKSGIGKEFLRSLLHNYSQGNLSSG